MKKSKISVAICIATDLLALPCTKLLQYNIGYAHTAVIGIGNIDDNAAQNSVTALRVGVVSTHHVRLALSFKCIILSDAMTHFSRCF